MKATMTKEKVEKNNLGLEIFSDVLLLKLKIVNVFLIGMPNDRNGDWVLVDAGNEISYEKIIEAAEQRFGIDCKLKAIILTHGHFDHIGSIEKLTKRWDVPIYAHEEELPYLTGKSDYLPPDPSVGGGMISLISPIFSNKGINLGSIVHPLPSDKSVPHMTGWRWIHTPGHTEGHISLYRDSDRLLIAGDAITTVKQESAIAVLTQEKELHGPPAYFTTDWNEAWKSVKRLEALKPEVALSSHGLPLYGEQLYKELEDLARNFDELAIPEHGRYVNKS